MDNELLTISVNTVVIGSEIIPVLILRRLNGSFAQIVFFTCVLCKESLPGSFQQIHERQNWKIENKLAF